MLRGKICIFKTRKVLRQVYIELLNEQKTLKCIRYLVIVRKKCASLCNIETDFPFLQVLWGLLIHDTCRAGSSYSRLCDSLPRSPLGVAQSQFLSDRLSVHLVSLTLRVPSKVWTWSHSTGSKSLEDYFQSKSF